MKLQTLIIDDEPIALEKLKNYVEMITFLTLARVCHNGFEAIEMLNSGVEVDLIITDINMPDLSGLDFVKSLSSTPMIIFTTAFSQYAVDSYKVSAVDYLLKPYSFADFSRAAGRAIAMAASKNQQHDAIMRGNADDSLFVKVDYRYVRISQSDIRFIKGFGEYIRIYIDGREDPLVTLSSFSAVMERLGDSFLQVHRSFIVNMNKIEQIERNRLVMDADNIIPVGDSYKNMLNDYLAAHAVGRSPK